MLDIGFSDVLRRVLGSLKGSPLVTIIKIHYPLKYFNTWCVYVYTCAKKKSRYIHRILSFT